MEQETAKTKVNKVLEQLADKGIRRNEIAENCSVSDSAKNKSPRSWVLTTDPPCRKTEDSGRQEGNDGDQELFGPGCHPSTGVAEEREGFGW